MKELQDKVVVITGASSGIGRATAAEFARKGAQVALAARDADALGTAEAECRKLGANTLAVVCDVTKEEQVEQLASRTEEVFGRIDIWVNNAGVALFAKFEDAPMSDFRRVIDTDFFGYVNGARSAIKRFKAQGSGTLINIDSVEGASPKPYNSAYSAAKHAVRALATSIRMELALEGAKDIHVSTVFPAPVDTPLYAHSANYTGQSVRAPETSISPLEVAREIVKVAQKPQREVVVGGKAKASIMGYLLAPNSYEHTSGNGHARRHLSEDEAEFGQGNLFESHGPHAIHGGWRKEQPQNMKKAMPWLALAGTVAAVGGVATWLFWPKAKPGSTHHKFQQKLKTQDTSGLRKLMPVKMTR